MKQDLAANGLRNEHFKTGERTKVDMDRAEIGTEPDSNWFVGATFDGNVDQTPRFLREGIGTYIEFYP